MSQQEQAHGEVKRAYERCLEARRQWMSVRGRTAHEGHREEAHADLHETVLAWFEALVPYIAERPGEVKELWENAPLWPTEPATMDVLLCPGCSFYVDRHPEEDLPFEGAADIFDQYDEPHGLTPGDQCPECGMPLEPDEITVYDDEGRVLYEWASGLKRLASWTNKTETVQVESDSWSTKTDVVEVPQRLDPTILLRAARYLDLAADECGLLESTDRALPTGEL